MKITAIECSFGYVESASLASVTFVSQAECFASEEEALQSLAKNLKAIYSDRHDRTPKPKKCCKKQKSKFCPDCGTKIGMLAFDFDQFQDWLVNIPSFNNDSWGYIEETDAGEEIIWQPGCTFENMTQMSKEGYDIMFLDDADRKIRQLLEMVDETVP